MVYETNSIYIKTHYEFKKKNKENGKHELAEKAKGCQVTIESNPKGNSWLPTLRLCNVEKYLQQDRTRVSLNVLAFIYEKKNKKLWHAPVP